MRWMSWLDSTCPGRPFGIRAFIDSSEICASVRRSYHCVLRSNGKNTEYRYVSAGESYSSKDTKYYASPLIHHANTTTLTTPAISTAVLYGISNILQEHLTLCFGYNVVLARLGIIEATRAPWCSPPPLTMWMDVHPLWAAPCAPRLWPMPWLGLVSLLLL